jgi:hypothetical protein
MEAEVGVMREGAGVAVMDLGEGVLAVTLSVHPSQVWVGAAFVRNLAGRMDLRTEGSLITGITVNLGALIATVVLGVLIATTASFSEIISSSDLISRHSGFQDGGTKDIRTTMAITPTVMPTMAMHRMLFKSKAT